MSPEASLMGPGVGPSLVEFTSSESPPLVPPEKPLGTTGSSNLDSLGSITDENIFFPECQKATILQPIPAAGPTESLSA